MVLQVIRIAEERVARSGLLRLCLVQNRVQNVYYAKMTSVRNLDLWIFFFFSFKCAPHSAVVRVKESSGVAQVASPKKNDATPSRRKTRRSIAQEEEEVVVPAKEEPLVEKREETPMSSKSDTEAQLPTLFEEGDGDACVFKTPSQSAVRRQRRLTSAEHLSSKRKKTFSTRNSLILRTLSPEEGWVRLLCVLLTDP